MGIFIAWSTGYKLEMSLFLCPSFVCINLHYLSLSHSEVTMPSNGVWFCTSRTSPQKMNLTYAVTSAGKQMECDKKMAVPPRSQWKQDKTVMPVNEAKWRVNVEDSSDNWEFWWTTWSPCSGESKTYWRRWEGYLKFQTH